MTVEQLEKANDLKRENREFLQWIYERMRCVYGEPENVDYMIKFKGIIDKTIKMKIVTKSEFYKLPDGTLYSEFDPQIFRGLKIKNETIYHDGEPIDFFYEDLIGNVDARSSDEYSNILTKCEEDGSEFNLDFECGERDGLYDDNALYAVYSTEEIRMLSDKIAGCVGYDSKYKYCALSDLKYGDRVCIKHYHLYKDGYWQMSSLIDYIFVGRFGDEYYFQNVNVDCENFKMREEFEDKDVFLGKY